MLRRILPLAVVVVFAGPFAFAQEITGTITGIVKDQTGGTVPGVLVSARSLRTGLVKEATTAESGGYVLPFLPVGEYEITFSLTGFQPFLARNVALHVNDRLVVNPSLAIGGQQEAIEVSAAAQLIQPTPAVQSLMGPTQVQELPLNNRNFAQLATLVPGVSSSLSDEVAVGLTSTMSISINGARRNAVNWLVDGASNIDVGSNITLLSTPTLESIEEFKIITSCYAAEWPRSGGGIINVVTKSGSNQLRMSAYEFTRNDALNANSFFRKQTGCTAPAGGGAWTCSNLPDDRAIRENAPRLRYNNFGYTLGGPIMKDKLFLFWSQEWRKISRAPASTAATVIDPAWLNDPTNANYVAPALRDPNAVRLLAAYPAPNVGTNQYREIRPNEQDTRQEVVRVDWHINPKWRLMGRYTHDLSLTSEPGGLFFGTAIPNVASTTTDVPGQVAVAQLTTTISPRMLNEFMFQYSSNAIASQFGDNFRGLRTDYSLAIPELYPENRTAVIPTVAISGLSSIGSVQLFDNDYKNFTFTDNLSYLRGNHTFKAGFLVALERKNELSTSGTQGSFSFAAGGGRTAFQNFLTGNLDGACGASCTYAESEREVGSQIRFNRYEFYVQDSWKVRPNLTLDLGLRYSIFPPVTDINDLLTNFDPGQYNPAQAPTFANAAGTVLVTGTGNLLNGIVVAGQNSSHGRGIYSTDFGNFQPRLGISWDVKSDGKTVVRGGYGIYYDQALVGTFLQNAFVNPPFVLNPAVENARLSNPAAGSTPTTRPLLALIATSDPFETPRYQQWNVGVQRQLYRRGVIDIGYAGSAGDQLIQPVDINLPQPGDVVALNSTNRARPFAGWAGINRRQTTARSRYHGLLVGFRHESARAGTFVISYTLSQAKSSATNDRDAIDLPQNPQDLEAEYAISRTDRTHVFTANYVYELPFFRNAKGLLKATIGGWQIAGITQFWSGPPISRVVNGTTNGNRRGIRVSQVSDPFANLPANQPGGVYWFNPAAFVSPADGSYGNTGRAIFRLPGVNQWDVTLSKNWYPTKETRLQFRADFINAFNHTQFEPTLIQNTCSPAVTQASCVVAGNRIGQITGTRSPREIQLGLRFSWR